MSADSQSERKIPRGMRLAEHPKSKISVLRIHYSADDAKDEAWAADLKGRMNPAAFALELEIDPYAKSGSLLYPEFTPEYTVRTPFPIPHEWTRYMAIDPHPRVPHAMLWMAVSPDDTWYFYREFWPSRAYGMRGNTPEDDDVYHIDDYVDSIKMLESGEIKHFAPNGFADNGGHNEHISCRIQDTAGKQWETQRDMGQPGEETFWDRYALLGIVCENPKKDFQAGRDCVGQRLRPRRISDGETESQQSQIVIFDTLHELILELKTMRYPTMTPTQAESRDPDSSPLKKRRHCGDCMRYLCMANPVYIPRSAHEPRMRYAYKGIPY